MTGAAAQKRRRPADPPRRRPLPDAGPTAAQLWVGSLAVFAAALAIRVLFWQAGPGPAWPHSIFFKGDALVWLEHALSLERGRVFELGLPLRPPGAAWLLALLWDG